jgi:hypothetical protein
MQPLLCHLVLNRLMSPADLKYREWMRISFSQKTGMASHGVWAEIQGEQMNSPSQLLHCDVGGDALVTEG